MFVIARKLIKFYVFDIFSFHFSFLTAEHVKQLEKLLEKLELTFIAFITALVILRNVQHIAVDAIRNDNELKFFSHFLMSRFLLLHNLSSPKILSCCHIALFFFFSNISFVFLLLKTLSFFFVCLVTLFNKINDCVFFSFCFHFPSSTCYQLCFLMIVFLKAFSLDLKII